jgi:hypothetical protein
MDLSRNVKLSVVSDQLSAKRYSSSVNLNSTPPLNPLPNALGRGSERGEQGWGKQSIKRNITIADGGMLKAV